MIYHYLKITWRNLTRRSGFSLLNLLGLTVGLIACLYIFQYVAFERGFNRAFTQLDQLHRVLMVSESSSNPLSPPALAPVVQEEMPQIQDYSRILDNFSGTITFSRPGSQHVQTYTEESGIYADGNLLELLGYPLTAGQHPVAPYEVAMAESKAEQYFGSAEAIGQTITLHNQFGKQAYTVTALYPDLPAQSDLQFDLLFSIRSFENMEALNQQGWAWLGHWDTWIYETILQIAPGTEMAIVERGLNAQKKNLPEQFTGSIGLQALTGLHLGGGPNAAAPTVVNARYINFFLLLGLLILIIAWVNYVNLSVAQALQRVRSIGVQRIVGATGRQIWGQYLAEAATFNGLALVLAVVITVLLQPLVNGLIDRPLGFDYLESSALALGGLAFLTAGMLVSGIYVAVVLTAFHPIEAIKGLIKRPGRANWVRNGMLVFQFAISTGLILGTAFMLRQLHYMQNKTLGAELEQVILVPGPSISDDETTGNLDAFRDQLEKLSYIQEISFSGLAPGEGYNYQAPDLVSENEEPGDDQITYASASVDDHYFDLYNIPILAGRNFRKEEVASFSWYEIDKVVLNETAAKKLHFESPQAAIGQNITWWGEKSFEVIGVVPDHHHMSLRETIKPMVFLGTENFGLLGLKINTGDLEERIGEIGALYSSMYPGNPFDYFFADENFASQYADQQRSASLFGLACGLAVFIACLGLLGLTIASVRQRTKEVGIRRILGATASQLALLLSREYILQVFIAFLIVIPVVYWLVNQWLQDFAYRTTMEWWVFAAGGLLALLLALITSGSQTLRAAWSNPVDSLRDE